MYTRQGILVVDWVSSEIETSFLEYCCCFWDSNFNLKRVRIVDMKTTTTTTKSSTDKVGKNKWIQWAVGKSGHKTNASNVKTICLIVEPPWFLLIAVCFCSLWILLDANIVGVCVLAWMWEFKLGSQNGSVWVVFVHDSLWKRNLKTSSFKRRCFETSSYKKKFAKRRRSLKRRSFKIPF